MSLALAVLIQVPLWPWFGSDFTNYLLPWFTHVVDTGPVASFARPFSDYAPAYLYLLAATTLMTPLASPLALLKLLSFAGTVALVAALARLLRACAVPRPWRGAALVALLPTVAINAGLLVQCDAMYAAALAMLLAAAVERRPRAALGWFGLAFAFKAQTVFLGPFLLGWALRERVPLRLWLVAPAVTAATLLPAALAGWPVGNLLRIYLHQAGTYPALSLNAPNVWTLVQLLPGTGGWSLLGLAGAIAAGASVSLAVHWSTTLPRGRDLLQPALLSALVVPGLLPMMHERYFFVADVLALAAALIRRDRASWWTAALVQSGSALAIAAYVVGLDVLAVLGALPMLLATRRVAGALLGGSAPAPALPAHRPIEV